MRILAIETTERIGSVAAMQDDKLLAQEDLSQKQRSAQSLAPGLWSLLREVGWQPKDVDLAAVSVGPGSFTGLRVGVTTAKAFAYAAGAEVLGVDTLRTIAENAPDDVLSLCAVVDAQRGELVSRQFERDDQGWFRPAGAQALVAVGVWVAELAAGTVVTGPVLRKIAARLPGHAIVLDPLYWPPKASNVARLAARDYAAGRRDDLWGLVPRYFRRSAAQEKYQPAQNADDR